MSQVYMQPEDGKKCICGDCGHKFMADNADPISDFEERVSPGEITPVGVCPECGALAHYDDDSAPEWSAQSVMHQQKEQIDRQQAVLDRIRTRVAGEWFDPTGDLESDIAKVLRELDGTAEADELEGPDDNPFDPESPEGRAVDRGDMSPDGSLKARDA